MMSSSNRILVILLAAVALAAAYWFLMLSLKKEEITTLDAQIEQLHSSIAQSEQAASMGEQAKASFETDYSQLVTLGKAVPDGDEQAALLVQLNQIGRRNNAFFSSLVLESSGATPPSAPVASGDAAVTPSTTAPAGEPQDSTVMAASPTAASANAVAALPIGATVGEAGLATLPYKLLYSGSFFKLADFIASIDGLVSTDSDGQIKVDGRLMTIDGFALSPQNGEDLSKLSGNFVITTFVTPPSQGLTGGATPSGPSDQAVTAANTTGTAP